MLIAQRIRNVLGGVSQRPADLRDSSQSDIMENMLSHWTFGLRRRPPTTHVAQLTANSTGYSTAFLHEVRETSTDRYVVVVVGGDLKVFDLATGAEQTVIFPQGKSYLTSSTGFKAFTVGDTTYLLNMSTVVKRGSHKAPTQAFEALLFVRQADYSTRYAVTINGNTVTVDTPDAASPAARLSIATDTLASQLVEEIASNDILADDFQVYALGSSVYVTRIDGADFEISSTDGLADKGLKVVKGSVQTFADLPARAVDGMIVQIAGDPESASDNYWVTYSDEAQPGQMGVWVECAAPGTPINLDATTMPWALKRGGTLLENIVADDAPQGPTVVSVVTTSSTGGFTSDPDTGDTYDGESDIVLSEQDDKIDAVVTGTGAAFNLAVLFDVDTTLLDYGESVTVTFSLDSGAGLVERDSRTYEYGLMLRGESLQWAGTLTAGSHDIRVQINYGAATTKVVSRQAIVTVHRNSNQSGPGIITSYTSEVDVFFNADLIYPVGTSVALTVDATTFTYTVSSSDKTGAQVATALTALITGYTATNPESGKIAIHNTGSTPITWTASCAVTVPSATTLYDSSVTLVGAAYVGKTINNLTDGSTGVITANGVHSITVSALTGGISNTFRGGDLCEIQGASSDFLFTTATWTERAAGDLDLCPLPSFVGHTLSEVFFHRNRLGFLSRQNVVLSVSGELTNFMRQTATALLDSDPIDIRSAHPGVSSFDHALEWNDVLVIASAAGHQFGLTGGDILSPQTVQLKLLASFPMSGTAKPITIGKYLFFGSAAGISSNYSQILQMYATPNDKADANAITQDVPQYLSGAPLRIAGDAAKEMLFVLTAGATDTLWAHSFHYEESENAYTTPRKLMSSWSKWTFSGATILSVSMLDGVLSLVVIRSGGVYLEKIDLGNLPAATADHRDRQGYGSPVSTTMRWRLSTVYLRNQQTMAAETRGRLQLRNANLEYFDATDFTVTVTPAGRAARTYTFHSSSAAAGQFLFQILTRNTYATIEITNSTTGGCAFSGVDWEGDYTARARRV